MPVPPFQLGSSYRVMRGLDPRIRVFVWHAKKDVDGRNTSGHDAAQGSIAHIMLPLAAVEAAGAQAAGFEICGRSRRGRGRCGRAFRSAPCRRGPCGRRGGRGSRTDNPRLRLRVTSKARQVVVIAIVCHDTPPWFDAGENARPALIWQRGTAMSSILADQKNARASRKLSRIRERSPYGAERNPGCSGPASRPAPDVATFDPTHSLPSHFTQFPGGALMRRR
jgi:hypothetical protein